MNDIQRTIQAIKVMQAFVDGYAIEAAEVHDLKWGDTFLPVWNWNNFNYRIKSVSVLRPWTADEVPLGAWMRAMLDPKFRWLILNVANDDLRREFFSQNEHSTDKGVTWLPCGVMEESK
jgi:hypothetical protein